VIKQIATGVANKRGISSVSASEGIIATVCESGYVATRVTNEIVWAEPVGCEGVVSP
jgi:hypothetical protein